MSDPVQGSAAPRKRPRALGTASWFAIAGLALVGAAYLMVLVGAAGLHGGAGAAASVDPAKLSDLNDSQNTWAGLALFGTLLCAAMFIPWFAMAYANLQRLGVQHVRWGTGWAVGAWFVPILGLVRPKQMANDLWRAGEPGADLASEGWRSGPVTAPVHWWWGLFLLGGLVGRFAFGAVERDYARFVHATRFGGSQEAALNSLRSGSVVEIVAASVMIGAAALGVVFVRRATERLEALRARAPQAVPAAAPLPDAPVQDLVRCPECAELVLPAGSCRYCGYGFPSFSANR